MNHYERQNRRRLTDFEDLGVLLAIWARQAIPYLQEETDSGCRPHRLTMRKVAMDLIIPKRMAANKLMSLKWGGNPYNTDMRKTID